tara:strand:- start:38 stop:241 length:204 start_codon:yes stop_codon:yes gene_type:complete
MTIEELNKKVEQLRLVTEAKMKYLRDHTKLIDQAFEELKEIQESELDLIYEKIEDLDKLMDINGLSR